MPVILKRSTGDQKAQHHPNNNPAEISRRYKPQAIYPALGHKKTPGTIDRGSWGGNWIGV